ncbi:MAG: type I-C CRISPR-associated protein Cas7/Csd2, partial [Hyphomicrobiales bacterium]
MTDLQNRYDFAYFFDVSNGNPNGDPDAGNLPRMDPETSHGLVSDVSIKSKIRNYVDMTRQGVDGHRIYVEENSILNDQHRQAYRAIRQGDDKVDKAKKLSPGSNEEAEQLRRWMCDNFYDVRTFGAVMSTGINCGQVRGARQFAFGRSVEPIMPMEIS